MDSLIILLLVLYTTGIFGVTEKCPAFVENQNSFEIACNNPMTNDCFPSNDLTGWHLIVGMKQVLHLKLKDCSSFSYEMLNSLQFMQHQLQSINGSHNYFTQLPVDFLLHAPNIIELDFSYNLLERVESTSFAGVSNLQRIHLSSNRIGFLADDAFTNLTELQYVNLNENQCHWIDMFRNNKQMHHLLIADNPVFNFDCNHFLKMSSITVVISWKDIRYFHTNCRGNQFNVFLSSQNHSESILPAQREIYCNEQSFKSIQQFSAGRNKFENVAKMLQCFAGSTLTEMDLAGNFVGTLNRTVFNRFRNLEWISLSDTILLDFDFDMLDAQREKLERLDVSFNNLMNLQRPELIRNFIQLKQFIAAECQLRNALEIISRLPSTIQYLDLSGNSVGQISTGRFQRLTNLHTLKLNGTHLAWPENTNPFEPCENLRILDISQNSLANVNFSALSATLLNLTDFNAANCQLQNAVQIIQYFRSKLEHLDLSGNRFTGHLDSSTFEPLFNLKTLSLSNVGLTSLDPKIFHAQQNLRFLNISLNHLTQMTFAAIPKSLVKLDIEWNDLTEIWNFDRIHLPALDSVSISKNRLQCSQLLELKHDWNGLKFSGDPMDQKYGNCASDDEQRLIVAANASSIDTDAIGSQTVSVHLQYSFMILTPIIGIILTGCIAFALYRQCEKFFNFNDEKRMSFELAYGGNEELEKPPTNENYTIAEHIYEEIDDYNKYDRRYDRLHFDTDPLPLKMVGDHYHNVNIRTDQADRVSTA